MAGTTRTSTSTKTATPELPENLSLNGTGLGADLLENSSSSSSVSTGKPEVATTAICVVGGIRSFIYKRVHENILKLVVNQLSPASVFFVLSRTKSVDQGGEGKGVQVRDRVPEGRLRDALAKFAPVHVEVHNRSDCATALLIDPGRFCCDDSEVEMFMQLYWIRRCFERVEKTEEERGSRFDLVVRIRPDVFYYEPFPFQYTLLRNGITLAKRAWDRPADWLFAVARHHLSFFHEAFEPLLQECETKRWCPERTGACWHSNLSLFGGHSLDGNGFEFSIFGEQRPSGIYISPRGHEYPFKSIDFSPVIVRGPHAADCRRLVQQQARVRCGRQTHKGWDT